MVVVIPDGDVAQLGLLPDASVRLLIFIPKVFNTYRITKVAQAAERVLTEGGSAVIARSLLEAIDRL